MVMHYQAITTIPEWDDRTLYKYACIMYPGERVTLYKDNVGMITTKNLEGQHVVVTNHHDAKALIHFASVAPFETSIELMVCKKIVAIAVPEYAGKLKHDLSIEETCNLCFFLGFQFSHFTTLQRNLQYWKRRIFDHSLQGVVLKNANYENWRMIKP